MDKRVLIVGGTGQMGSQVLQHLGPVRTPGGGHWLPRVITRDPAGDRARALADVHPGVEMVAGSVSSDRDLRAALDGVEAVFCNTDYWSLWGDDGRSLETEVGWTLLRLAKEAGVEHFIYSSAEHASALSGWKIAVPHFDAKAEVELRINESRHAGDEWFRRCVSVLRTAPYYENFLSFFLPRASAPGETLQFSLPIGEARWTMVALSDIGWFAAHMLADRNRWGGCDLSIASESLTLREIASIFTEVTGRPATGVSIDDNTFAAVAGDLGQELLAMFRFVRTYGLRRDFQALREIHPGLLGFRDWVGRVNWEQVLE